jgi:hypothetical protein
MYCITLVAQIVDRPALISGSGGPVVVGRVRPLDSPDCNWRIETPLDDNSVPLLYLRPGATVFLCGEFAVDVRRPRGVKWAEVSLTVDRLGVIDRGSDLSATTDRSKTMVPSMGIPGFRPQSTAR